jgi:probable addiction module antidote protein
MKSKNIKFEADLNEKLQNPEFASAYIMSAIIDHDLDFLPIALGDVAKAHGFSKLSEQTGIHRRTLYKVFDKNGNPSFGIINQIIDSMGLKLQVIPKKTKRKKAS